MFKLPPLLLVVAVAATPCRAAPPFTCGASGDGWSVQGSPSHAMACSFRCILRDAAGLQDTVSCAPRVSPGTRATPICEGFLLGKHWTSATLVMAECASVEQ